MYEGMEGYWATMFLYMHIQNINNIYNAMNGHVPTE